MRVYRRTERGEWPAEPDTSTQRAAIVRVLEALAHGERFSHYRQEIEAALASWKRDIDSP